MERDNTNPTAEDPFSHFKQLYCTKKGLPTQILVRKVVQQKSGQHKVWAKNIKYNRCVTLWILSPDIIMSPLSVVQKLIDTG